MPSPIGHVLAGVATALAADIADPVGGQRSNGARLAGARELWTCGFLAAAPDLDLVYPPIHRTATHSVTAVMLAFIIAAALTGQVTRWRTATVCALAYASHLLLDWLGADTRPPLGVQLLWPFSPHWFISGANLFRETSRIRVFTAPVLLANARTAAQEIAILLPIVIVLWLVRVKTAPRLPPKLSRGHHPAE